MNNNLDTKSIVNRVTRLIPLITLFLVPIFYLPLTTEFFAFNKLSLILAATILLVVISAVKIVVTDKLEFIKSQVDISLLFLAATVVLGTVFPISKTDSIYGSPGRWIGLFTLLVLMVFYYIFSSNFKSVGSLKTALLVFLASSTISTFISLLSYYKIYVGSADYLKIPLFTLTGSINDSVLLAALAVITCIALISKTRSIGPKISLMAVSVLNFYYVAVTSTVLGWAVVLLGIVAVGFFLTEDILESKIDLIPLLTVYAVIIAAVFVPTTSRMILSESYKADLILPIRESWFISTSTIQDFPLLATGPSTFHLNFTRYRPLSLNNTDLWNVQFSLPYNAVFDIMATLGVVGIIVMINFAWKTTKYLFNAKKVNEGSGIAKIFAVLVLSTLISFAFTYMTVLNLFVLFAMLGLLSAAYVTTASQQKYAETMKVSIESVTSLAIDDANIMGKNYLKFVLMIPALAFSGYVGYLGYRLYSGEYFMRKAITAALNNDGGNAYNYQLTAISKNPKRDSYYSSYARTNLALANSIASKADLTDADKQTIQTLLSQAIRNVRIATETLSPLNARNWETRAVIYRSMINVAADASEWAINSYNTAISLDPTNPSLRVDLGGIYYAKADYLSAANQFRQATVLKPNYASAHYNFAMALVQLGDLQQAARELETTKSLVPQDSEDFKLVEKDIATLVAAQPSVAGAETQKPTVEELAGTEEKTATEQEPITNVGEEKPEEKNLDTEVLPEETGANENVTGTSSPTTN